MELTMKLMSTVVMIIACAFSLIACAAKTTPLSAPGALAVIILPATDVEIFQTSARQDGGSVYVEGKLQRKMPRRRAIPTGHVDIAIVDEKGKTLYQVPTSYTPESIPKTHGMKSSFMVRIPVEAPPGSFISVKFHSGHHGD